MENKVSFEPYIQPYTVYHGIKETIGLNRGRRYVSVTYLHSARNSFSSNVFRAYHGAAYRRRGGEKKKFITEFSEFFSPLHLIPRSNAH